MPRKGLSPLKSLTVGTALATAVGYVDFITGWQVAFTSFYLIPISVTWWAGKRAGIVLAILCGLCASSTEFLWGIPYVHPLIPYWNTTSRLLVFVLIAWLIGALRDQVNGLEDAVDSRTKSLHEQIDLVEAKKGEITEAQAATIFALAKLAEHRDEDTGKHLERVRDYCQLLAEELRKDTTYVEEITDEFIHCLSHAVPLHDIGKVAIPDGILQKPGKLTPEEFEIIKTHTVIGAQNMQEVFDRYPGNEFVGMGINIARYHHERWDGQGYPDGLNGTDIPLPARIMAVADVYDALRSDRCYRKGLTHERTMEIMLEGQDTQFDPDIIGALLRKEDEFRSTGYR